MENKKLYRDKALEKLVGNKNLDSMLSIVKPVYWFAAIGGGLLLLVLVIWGIFGYIYTTTDCYGFNYTAGYTNTYYCDSSGVVMSVNKDSGRLVHQGETLYTYRDAKTGIIAEQRSLVTGIIIKHLIFPGSIIVAGQEACTIRAFSNADSTVESLYEPGNETGQEKKYDEFEKIIYLCVAGTEISKIQVDQEVIIKPVSGTGIAPITGTISKVGAYLTTPEEFNALFGFSISGSVASMLSNTIICECKIKNLNGLSKNPYAEGESVTATIVTGKAHPFELLFSKLVS